MIGVDIVQISRIQNAKRRFGSKFVRRFLCEREIALVRSDASLAGFWAAKEACAKALGCGIGAHLSFLDLGIFKTKQGKPFVRLSERAKLLHKIEKHLFHFQQLLRKL